jgi:hypothetical protein
MLTEAGLELDSTTSCSANDLEQLAYSPLPQSMPGSQILVSPELWSDLPESVKVAILELIHTANTLK